MKKTNFNSPVIITMVLAIIFGLLSGFLAYVFLASSGLKLPFFGQINFAAGELGQQIVIDQPRTVVVDQDLQLSQVKNDLLSTLVSIYPAKKSSSVLSKIYPADDRAGQGFVLTADGWVVTSQTVIDNAKNHYVGVGYQAKIYDFEKFVSDPATGLVFGKLSASGLPVAKIGKSKDLTLGQTVVVASGRDRLSLTHIAKIGYDFSSAEESVQSSESFKRQIFLALNLDGSFNGAVVVNLKGEIIGLVSAGRVVLVDDFKNVFPQVLANQKIVRPYLGVKYIDLSQVDGLIDQGDKGALIYAAPAKDSPAADKLKAGDIVKRVNGVEINSFQNLSELIGVSKAGDKVDLLLSRQGQEQTVDFILK